jgi:hypothetical protein
VGIHREPPLNIDLNINNERLDCKIGTVHVVGTSGRGECMKGIRWGFMVEELHIPIWNRTKKPLALSVIGRGLGGWEDDTTTV